jgi:hypothetical protein
MTAHQSSGALLRMPVRAEARPVWKVVTRALHRLPAEGTHSVLVPRGAEAVDFGAAAEALGTALDLAMHDQPTAQLATSVGPAAHQLFPLFRRLFLEEMAADGG